MAQTQSDWPAWAGGGPGTGSISIPISSPGIGHIVVFGVVYGLAFTLIVIDGPLPVGDAAAASIVGRWLAGNTWKGAAGRLLLAVPDVLLYQLGGVADDKINSIISFNNQVSDTMWIGPGTVFYVR